MFYFKEAIQSALEKDPAAPGFWGVLLTYPGVHALLLHRLAYRLWINEFFLLARFIASFSRFMTAIEIHPAAVLGRRLFIDHGCGLVIGETAEVGDDCTLYHGVTLGGVDLNDRKRHPTLGNKVIVGAGAKVLGSCHIGNNARIGSNAVVLSEVPENTTAVGIPARIIFHKGSQKPICRMSSPSYGVSDDVSDDNDPLIAQVDSLQKKIQALEKQIKQLKSPE